MLLRGNVETISAARRPFQLRARRGRRQITIKRRHVPGSGCRGRVSPVENSMAGRPRADIAIVDITFALPVRSFAFVLF